ncbi:hypothetical protein [Streptomyces rubiginosohelvolus]|uniref:hypothetical protein n=1 Tax=Streptomyces rubiginosohelvolus TaxID=67362 RepID=UPI00371088B7
MTDTSPTTPDRPADQLRAAAEKLREEAVRAHRASPAPWAVTDEHVVRCSDGMIVADRSDTDHPAERADLPYIALLHPGVGLALAAWLESAAERLGDTEAPLAALLDPSALAVARQLLGTTSEDTTAEETDEEREQREDREETDREHAVGIHTHCGLTCEVDLPTEHLRNFVIAKGYPGTAGALDELLRRAAAAPPAPADRAAVLREAAEALDQRAAVLKELSSSDYGEESFAARELTEQADRLRRLAGEAAAGAHHPTEGKAAEEQPVVAYRDPNNPHMLFCRTHGERWAGLSALTFEDLPNGGICTLGHASGDKCGRDVLGPVTGVKR